MRLIATDPSLKEPDAAPAAGQELVRVLVDSAYALGPMLEALETPGHTALVRPKPQRPAVPGGFDMEDFGYDQDCGTLTCPAGGDARDQSEGEREFRGALQELPVAGSVHESQERAQGRDHRAPRATAGAPGRGESPGVPGRVPGQAHAGGTGYRVAGGRREPAVAVPGVAKNDAWRQSRVAMLNLKRLLNLGLGRGHEAWRVG